MNTLLLASTSPYRRELLQRLRLPFDCARPQVDESPLPGEAPAALAVRLAAAKAAEETDPDGDTYASAEYKRHVASVYARKAIETAVERASRV